MRLTTITTALFTAAAMCAASVGDVAEGASGERDDDGIARTASFHLTTSHVSIALQAVAGGGRFDVPMRMPAFAHVVVGVSLPDFGFQTVHGVGFSAPRLAHSGGAAGHLERALDKAHLRMWVEWSTSV